jgi:cytochrome P450
MHSALIFLLPLALISAYAFNWYLCFRRNIKKAKESGLPYVIVPVFVLNRTWLVTHPIWLKLARKYLPYSWIESWHDYTLPDFTWELRYEPFKRLGADTFLAVSGGDFCLWTADADVISQITTRRNDFPKPTHIYSSVDIYGKNVVSTEGTAWRRHRKLTSPPFTEKNNTLVWTETIDQTQSMLESWVGKDMKADRRVERIMDDTMRLSLHVISRAGFGRKLAWPSEAKAEAASDQSDIHPDPSKIENKVTERDAGHSMSYVYALHCLLENILWTFLVKHWVLKRSPFKAMRHAYKAYVEWGNYMREMVSSKKAAIRAGKGLDEMDIMGQLVIGQVLQSDKKSSSKDAPLSDSEILGNAFVLILAGHETVANSIHFAILLLALNFSSQRTLQKDLEKHFQGRPISDWDYDRDLPALFGGRTGAVMNEELRLIGPVVNVPKSTYGVSDQPLDVNGKKCTLPANTYISLCTSAVHRNPKWWPHGPPRDPKKPAHAFSNLDNDLEEFKPERWILDGEGHNPNGKTEGGGNKLAGFSTEAPPDSEDLGLNTASDTSASLYHPSKGAFIPFSEGFRACIGRRFAQIEILTALAVIFSQYSVELDVGKYATIEEVERMGTEERKQVWQKAADDATRLIDSSTTIITLQMRSGHVPVRFVRKGEERFDFGT